MRVTAFILARAGSKGLPGKNIAPFMGKPLIAWSIEAARQCAEIDDVFVSTDGDDIARVAHDFGCEVLQRPEYLAGDTAMPKDAIRYHVDALAKANRTPDISVLLQPTSPLRTAQDIADCVMPIKAGECDSAATFMRSPSSPYRAWTQTETGPKPFIDGHDPWRPRQALPETFALNGAVYAMNTEIFLADVTHSFLPGRSRMVLMPDLRSVDIDTALDLKIAEAIAKADLAAGLD